jgi:hypothetical protein
MFLTNALNLEYKHIESGKLYTLLYLGNVDCDQTVLDDMGLPKWEPRACYRSNETGEIFIRRTAEFETNYVLTFPTLEVKLNDDFNLIKTMGLSDDRSIVRRRIALLGIARELWSLFPLIKEENRVAIVRALNFTDFIGNIDEHDSFFLTHLGQAFYRLPSLFADAGATLHSEEGKPSAMNIKAEGDVNNVLGLLMIGLASTVREYRFLTAINVEEAETESHRMKIETLVESAKATSEWFDKIGVNVALPTMVVTLNTFDPNFLTETN